MSSRGKPINHCLSGTKKERHVCLCVIVLECMCDKRQCTSKLPQLEVHGWVPSTVHPPDTLLKVLKLRLCCLTCLSFRYSSLLCLVPDNPTGLPQRYAGVKKYQHEAPALELVPGFAGNSCLCQW